MMEALVATAGGNLNQLAGKAGLSAVPCPLPALSDLFTSNIRYAW